MGNDKGGYASYAKPIRRFSLDPGWYSAVGARTEQAVDFDETK